MLTTKEAWRYIAEQYLRRAAGEDHRHGDAMYGLCGMTSLLRARLDITEWQEKAMDAETHALMAEHGRIGFLVHTIFDGGMNTDELRGTLALIFAEAE